MTNFHQTHNDSLLTYYTVKRQHRATVYWPQFKALYREGTRYIGIWPYKVFIHSTLCLTTGPLLLLNRVRDIMRSSDSSFNFQYYVLSLRSFRYMLISSSSPYRHFFPSFCISFSNVFQQAVPMQCVTNTVSLPFFIVRRIFFSSVTLCSTSSFFTPSIQKIFSILLQHHIWQCRSISDLLSELSKCL